MTEFKLPELGENVDSAEVIKVLVSEGDTIDKDQDVLSMETEKAAFELPCPYAGKVTKVHVHEGDTISVGDVVLTLEEAEAAQLPHREEKPPSTETAATQQEQAEQRGHEEPDKPPEKAGTVETTPVEAVTEPPAEQAARKEVEAKQQPRRTVARESALREGKSQRRDRRFPAPAGPATRRLARELGIDLQRVSGSARGGRITRDDVKQFAHDRMAADQTDLQAVRLPDFAQWGPVERRRLTKIQRTSAERLQRAWQIVPHVTQQGLADITELETMRKQHEATRKQSEPKLTITALIVKAVVAALKTFPKFNSSFDASQGELILKHYYHIGIAVDTENGLLVPVIRDADRKSVLQLAGELHDVAEKSRNRQIGLDRMRGGTFTITNLGGIGGTAFSPIVNYPEVAILGVARARWEPGEPADEAERRLRLPLCLSYDHRAIDGADGARFIVKIAQLLSDPSRLFLEG